MSWALKALLFVLVVALLLAITSTIVFYERP